ncbi:MAG: hypothetical protein RLZZ244_1255 [Verrucomicrobiota bacterium]
MEQGEALGFRDLVEMGFPEEDQFGVLADEKAPCGGDFVQGNGVGFGDEVEEVGCAPLDEAFELGVGVELGGEALDLLEELGVLRVSGAGEVDGVELLEEGVSVEDGGVIEAEEALELEAALMERAEAVLKGRDGARVPTVVGAGGFALKHGRMPDGVFAGEPTCAVGVGEFEVGGTVCGDVESEAVMGECDFGVRDFVSLGAGPLEGELLEFEVGFGLAAAHEGERLGAGMEVSGAWGEG